MQDTQQVKIEYVQGKFVVHVAAHRGEELFLHLANQGIEATVVRRNGCAQLELEEDVNLEALRAVLDQCE
jgi:hypothetical protein